jgi:hypothetical protein
MLSSSYSLLRFDHLRLDSDFTKCIEVKSSANTKKTERSTLSWVSVDSQSDQRLIVQSGSVSVLRLLKTMRFIDPKLASQAIDTMKGEIRRTREILPSERKVIEATVIEDLLSRMEPSTASLDIFVFPSLKVIAIPSSKNKEVDLIRLHLKRSFPDTIFSPPWGALGSAEISNAITAWVDIGIGPGKYDLGRRFVLLKGSEKNVISNVDFAHIDPYFLKGRTVGSIELELEGEMQFRVNADQTITGLKTTAQFLNNCLDGLGLDKTSPEARLNMGRYLFDVIATIDETVLDARNQAEKAIPQACVS